MKKISIIMLLALTLLVSGCSSNTDANNLSDSRQVAGGLSITSKGIEWNVDKNTIPFEEVIAKVPFQVKQPELPFEVTNKSATIIDAPFDLIQIIYTNVEQGVQLVLAESNSSDRSKSDGKKGSTLKNGSQTWIQGNSSFSAIYWRHEDITYTLLSSKIEDGKFVPHYTDSELIEIANKIN